MGAPQEANDQVLRDGGVPSDIRMRERESGEARGEHSSNGGRHAVVLVPGDELVAEPLQCRVARCVRAAAAGEEEPLLQRGEGTSVYPPWVLPVVGVYHETRQR